MEFLLNKEYLPLFWRSYRLGLDSRGILVWKRQRWWFRVKENFVLQALQDQIDEMQESSHFSESCVYQAVENVQELENQAHWSEVGRSILRRWREKLQERLNRNELIMNELELLTREILRKAAFIPGTPEMGHPRLETIEPLVSVAQQELYEEEEPYEPPATINILEAQDDLIRRGHYLLKRLLSDKDGYWEPIISYFFLLAGRNTPEAQLALKSLCESLGAMPSLETFLEYCARLGRNHPQNHAKIVDALSKTLWFYSRVSKTFESIAAAFFAEAELQDESIVLPFALGEEGEWNSSGQYKVLFKVPLGDTQNRVYIKGVRLEDLFIRKALEMLEAEVNRKLTEFEVPTQIKPWRRASLRRTKKTPYLSKRIEAFLAYYASLKAV